MLNENFKLFGNAGRRSDVAVTALWGETAETDGSLCDFEKFYKTSSSRALDWAGCERHHPSATSPGSNGLLQTGVFDCVFDVCIAHTHLLFFCQNISRQHSVRAHKWIF